MASPHELYADGGVVGKNPSLHGGTWCFLHVCEGKVTLKKSGLITPGDLKVKHVTNNHMEAYAVLQALLSVPREWDGTVWTDSMITIYRFRHSVSFNGMPTWLTDKVLERRRNFRYTIHHCKGHPTQKELAAGKSRNGRVVSKWNALCDQECSRLAADFLSRVEKGEK